MPLNKYQYNQRIEIIKSVITNLKNKKIKVEYLTDLCKIISKEVALIELDLFVKNPENFKSQPKAITYQTLLTNKDYKKLVSDFFGDLTSKPININKQSNFEKDLEISNLKEKIRRLEIYISDSESDSQISTANKKDSNDLNNAYILIQKMINTFEDILVIDTEKKEIVNLSEYPAKAIVDRNISKGFLEFLEKNKLKNS